MGLDDVCDMLLHFEEKGEGPPLVLVHGLFGSGTNLRGVARVLAEGYRVVTVDLQNHGRSPHTDAMTYPAMSAALEETMRALGLAKPSWVGHSMGGKAVMELALTRPDLVQRLVVVDIAPVRYPHTQWPLINAMAGLDTASLASRAEADRLLAAQIPDAATRLFLLQNLVPGERGYRWRLNLPVLAAHHDEIMGFPEHPGRIFGGRVLVLNGERSAYVTAEHRDAFRRHFPRVEFETIAGAGHWVHADRPREVCLSVARFLESPD